MTGHGSIETAVRATKLGAFDFIEKPLSLEKIVLRVRNAVQQRRLEEENQTLRNQLGHRYQVIGDSIPMKALRQQIAVTAPTNGRVLIYGESGTGKELVARAMHFRGAFAGRPFVAVDCGSLVPTLIESELFGYEKGAFTGALKSKQGLFQAADGGTIFLDEVGELPLELQAKLLRVLQEKEVRPVGSNQRVKVDVRVIAATNRDLEAAYKNGTFRKDLYFRLNVVTLYVPSLRERRSDIPMLVHWFLERYAPGGEQHVSSAAMKMLMQYEWPGNVRELENCVERAVALGNGQIIELSDLPPAIASGAGLASTPVVHTKKPPVLDPDLAEEVAVAEAPRGPLSTTDLEDIERATIQRVFEQVKGDKALAGRMLGISRATLYRKLKRYNIGVGSSAAGSSSHTLQ
jgi:DNA-binding NtrC family response regulator